MAERRMFAKTIIDSDAFLDMPLSTQALYFHLSMRADDEGFINNPKKIQRVVGASDDDLKLLLLKNFIISFETGIVVIKHWKIHNYIQKDRYRPTVYKEERSLLEVKENKAYSLSDTGCMQDVYSMETSCTPRIGKDRLGKDSIDNIICAANTAHHPPEPITVEAIEVDSVPDTYLPINEGSYQKPQIIQPQPISEPAPEPQEPKRKRFIPPTVEEVQAYCKERGNNVDAYRFIDYYSSNGWMVGRTKMKDWKAAVRTWERTSYSTNNNNRRKEVVPDWMKKQGFNDFAQTKNDAALDEMESYLLQEVNAPKTIVSDPELATRAARLREKIQGG